MRPLLVIALLLGAGCASVGAQPKPDVESLALHSLSECGTTPLDPIGPLDIAIVIDSSRSSADPTGFDINMNGEVGKLKRSSLRRVSDLDDLGSTDPGDSYLSAQVSAARSLVVAMSNTDARFSIVAFSGVIPGAAGARIPRREADAVIESGLTRDSRQLEEALNRVLKAGSGGGTRFSAGMALANQTLIRSPDPGRSARKLVLFMSDSAFPVLPNDVRDVLRGREIGGRGVDPEMKEHALVAVGSEIVFNTFGLGDAATRTPPHTLSRIAKATGGAYTAVEDATHLHCDLARSVLP